MRDRDGVGFSGVDNGEEASAGLRQSGVINRFKEMEKKIHVLSDMITLMLICTKKPEKNDGGVVIWGYYQGVKPIISAPGMVNRDKNHLLSRVWNRTFEEVNGFYSARYRGRYGIGFRS
ncbi:hypothetical protein HanRHA438_Chr05g0245451 [Helianthus annuus]|nr:hypothetical protein HanRHA438_Chr05g0245451 [Helianthus annuus]